LLDTGKVAGFKLSPKGPIDTASGGFATDKESLEQLIVRVNTNTEIGLKAREFLEKSIRYSAVGTYIATFVDGIERNRGAKGILHTKLMQCVARTGRLSSQDPNFQNMPRANTFPVRRVVTSRFVNGRILEVDFAQLEFRIAAYLAQDARAIQDIADKIDAHSFTAKTLTDAGQSTNRQDAKPHTFKPLYGGSSGTDAEVTYYKAFKEKYCGITRWQDSNIQSVLRGDVLRIPSGREYLFPGTRRTPSGYVVNTTQICNYPVQGFATADVVPVVIIEILRRLRKASCRSLLILTVHDSVVLDVHPDELEIINGVVCGSFGALLGILKSRYGCEVNLPLDHETKIGQNWLEMKTI
jgi:DNA polymerase-1